MFYHISAKTFHSIKHTRIRTQLVCSHWREIRSGLWLWSEQINLNHVHKNCKVLFGARERIQGKNAFVCPSMQARFVACGAKKEESRLLSRDVPGGKCTNKAGEQMAAEMPFATHSQHTCRSREHLLSLHERAWLPHAYGSTCFSSHTHTSQRLSFTRTEGTQQLSYNRPVEEESATAAGGQCGNRCGGKFQRACN